MTRQELVVVVVTMLAIIIFGGINMRNAQVLARDIQRKNDLKHVAAALRSYREDIRSYPKSENGKIVACGDQQNPRVCLWGKEGIGDYINPLPEDPLPMPVGYDYTYISNARDFQLFARLERRDDAEYNVKIANRKLACGHGECNFGIASSDDVPLDQELGIYAASDEATPK